MALTRLAHANDPPDSDLNVEILFDDEVGGRGGLEQPLGAPTQNRTRRPGESALDLDSDRFRFEEPGIDLQKRFEISKVNPPKTRA